MSVYMLYHKKNDALKTAEGITVSFDRVPFFSKKYNGRISNIYWNLISKKVYVCEVSKDGETVHYSYVMTKNYKFPFMDDNTFMVGPSYTPKDERGKGYLAAALDYLSSEVLSMDPKAELVALIREENVSSRKGFEKGGYEFSGEKYVKNRLKVYHRYD